MCKGESAYGKSICYADVEIGDQRVGHKIQKIIRTGGCIIFPDSSIYRMVLTATGAECEILTVSEMCDTYGLTNTKKNTLLIREDVYLGAIAGNPRDRFTLCHELGHFLLHTPDRVSFARGEIPAYRNPEWQANTFAGELMAPYNLTCCMSVEEIMSKCGMSRQAAEIQYKSFRK